MNPIKVRLPAVEGTGGRKGWNKLVVGVKDNDELQGEFLEGGEAEILPGDVLVTVKPTGNARDKGFGVIVWLAADQAHGNLRPVRTRTDWPACKEIIARDVRHFLELRPAPGEQPTSEQCPCDAPAGGPTSIKVEIEPGPAVGTVMALRATLDARQAIIRALELGVSPHELQTILTAAIVCRPKSS
jgi:hypothetical protein